MGGGGGEGSVAQEVSLIQVFIVLFVIIDGINMNWETDEKKNETCQFLVGNSKPKTNRKRCKKNCSYKS